MITIVNQFVRLVKGMIIVIKPASLKNIPGQFMTWVNSAYGKLRHDFFSIDKKRRNLLKTNLELGIYHFYRGNILDAHFRFMLLKICTYKMREVIHYNLGRCYAAEKRYKKASKYLLQALDLKNNFPEVDYYLAKINDHTKIEQVPLSILQERFDYMSSYYTEECSWAQQYKVILNEITDYFHSRSNIINILDVGSGTGACAQFLKMNHIGNNITGVDISNNMVALAQEFRVHDKPVYDQLLNMNVDDYLLQHDSGEQFDLILSIDASCYQSSLTKLFSKYKNALKVGGIILCLFRKSSAHDVEFAPKLDLFQYSQDYMLHLSQDIQMEAVKVIKCQLYNDIDGLLCMFKRVG